MEKKVIDKIVEERKKVVDQVELLLNTSGKDIASFVCGEMEHEEVDSLRRAFEMLEDYRHEKELSKKTGVPSIRMVKYEPCLKLLESDGMQRVYNLYVTHKEGFKAMQRREMMWRAFQERSAANILSIETAEVLAAGSERSVYVFSSESNTSQQYKWQMKLYMPMEKGASLDIIVERPNGVLLDGTLIFCGNELSVKDGATSIPYDVYEKTYTKQEIAFRFKDGKTIPGYPEI